MGQKDGSMGNSSWKSVFSTVQDTELTNSQELLLPA